MREIEYVDYFYQELFTNSETQNLYCYIKKINDYYNYYCIKY